MNIHSSEHILLTGAGFTKDFGAPLANAIWAEILNHNEIQAQSRIRKLMMDERDCDFESIYTSIMEDKKYTEEERNAINHAMKFVYHDIDTTLRNYARRVPHPVQLNNLNEFIGRFNENGPIYGPNGHTRYLDTKNKSFIFTLNQDLFFERLYSNSELSIPGITKKSDWFTSYWRDELSERDYCQLPNIDKLNQFKPNILSDGNFFFIKLHGSCNWKSFDGKPKMVIGRGKAEQIEKEPLLNYYFDIFKKVLFQKERRLLIVGYGFRDEHINNIIAEAVRCYELKIYIISPDLPKDLKNKLINENADYLWQGVSGYFQNRLIEIFPEDSYIPTQASKNLIKNFFQ